MCYYSICTHKWVMKVKKIQLSLNTDDYLLGPLIEISQIWAFLFIQNPWNRSKSAVYKLHKVHLENKFTYQVGLLWILFHPWLSNLQTEMGAHRENFRTIVVRIVQKFHLPLRVIMSPVMVMAGYIYYGAYRGREVKANWKYQQMDYSYCDWRWYQEKEKKEKTQGDIKKVHCHRFCSSGLGFGVQGLEVLKKVGSIFQYLACSDGHFTMQIHTGKI